jgi:hypothetical protein
MEYAGEESEGHFVISQFGNFVILKTPAGADPRLRFVKLQNCKIARLQNASP